MFTGLGDPHATPLSTASRVWQRRWAGAGEGSCGPREGARREVSYQRDGVRSLDALYRNASFNIVVNLNVLQYLSYCCTQYSAAHHTSIYRQCTYATVR